MVLSPVVQIPVELEKLLVVVEHDLPGREQLEQIARGIATEDGELPEGDKLGTVLDAACGLTRFEAEGAFSLSLVRHGHLAADSIWDLKSQTLKKSGLLQLHRGSERFDSLGGLSGDESVLPPFDAAPGPRQPAEASQGRAASLAARLRKIAVRQVPGQRGRAGPR